MDAAVSRASEALAEALTIVVQEALIGAGFSPSDKLLDKIRDEIRFSLTLK